MGTQTDYFERIGYKPKYFLGDRVHGKFNNIPFIGTVGNDRVIDFSGPQIVVHLDLPIAFEEHVYNIIIVKHKDVTPLKEIALEADRIAKASKTSGSGFDSHLAHQTKKKK